MFKKSDDDSKKSHSTTWKEGYSASNLRFERLEDGISDSSEHHDNNHLSDTQIQEDFILVFDVYGNFVLHEKNSHNDSF